MAVETVASMDRLLCQLDRLALRDNEISTESVTDTEKRLIDENNIPTATTVLCSPTPLTSLELHHQVLAIPKLQHFSRRFTVWALINDAEAGQAQAQYIDRPRLKKLKPKSLSKSLEQFNSGDSDGLAFALQLFNDNGTLQSKHKRHPWGSELDRGAVLVLSYLLVEKEFRRQGIAQVLIHALIERAKRAKGGLDFVFVKPGVIKTDLGREQCAGDPKERDEIEERAYGTAVKFYRSVGFRRVGGSRWFCLVLDLKHASHSIAVEDDSKETGSLLK